MHIADTVRLESDAERSDARPERRGAQSTKGEGWPDSSPKVMAKPFASRSSRDVCYRLDHPSPGHVLLMHLQPWHARDDGCVAGEARRAAGPCCGKARHRCGTRLEWSVDESISPLTSLALAFYMLQIWGAAVGEQRTSVTLSCISLSSERASSCQNLTHLT